MKLYKNSIDKSERVPLNGNRQKNLVCFLYDALMSRNTIKLK